MATPLLRVENLSVHYMTAGGAVRAVDGISFELEKGEILGLAGESGSGKSTVAHAILRTLPPPAAITGGGIYFDGREMLALSAKELGHVRWRDVSVVFQSALSALNPVLRIGRQIADVIVAHEHVSWSAAHARANELLSQVGIDPERGKSYPHELSGGMRQRVVIAIALALRPRLMIMDEPTTALDVVVQREILEHLRELRARVGFSILFITHDLPLMLEFCNRIAILYAGKIAESGDAHEFPRAARHPYSEGLLRSSPSLTGPRETLQGIAGQAPDMRQPPAGCRFHPRCPRVVAECSLREPALISLGPRHHAACHLLEPGDSPPNGSPN